MSKYGYCEDCGCVMEVVGCSNCNELSCIQHFQTTDVENLPETSFPQDVSLTPVIETL